MSSERLAPRTTESPRSEQRNLIKQWYARKSTQNSVELNMKRISRTPSVLRVRDSVFALCEITNKRVRLRAAERTRICNANKYFIGLPVGSLLLGGGSAAHAAPQSLKNSSSFSIYRRGPKTKWIGIETGRIRFWRFRRLFEFTFALALISYESRCVTGVSACSQEE